MALNTPTNIEDQLQLRDLSEKKEREIHYLVNEIESSCNFQ